MNYTETLTFLYENLPMFQRTGQAAYKANLDNTLRLDEGLGHPHRRFRSIHVAGTNGKGSVSHMLASVFMESGYKTALYTSPHLLDFRERIRLNGIMIPPGEVTRFVNRHMELIREIAPSFFEITAMMAFDYFAREEPDIAVIETGMGGRLDSTNVIQPELAVITNISSDHARFLGPTTRHIAGEKAGIIKHEVPVVLGSMDPGLIPVFTHRASALHAPLYRADQARKLLLATLTPEEQMEVRFRVPSTGETEVWQTDLTGSYQQENLQTVLAALDVMRSQGWNLPPGLTGTGLAGVIPRTGLHGRWETLGYNPRMICDTGHNSGGIRTVVRQLDQLPAKTLHMVFGSLSDKEPEEILSLLPPHARYYFVRSSVPRSADPAVLKEKGAVYGLSGEAFEGVEEGIRAAQREAGPTDVIFIGGSTFVVADALSLLRGEQKGPISKEGPANTGRDQ